MTKLTEREASDTNRRNDERTEIRDRGIHTGKAKLR